MEIFIYGFGVGLIVGSIVTALIYHNNQAAFNKKIADAEALAAKAAADTANIKAAAQKAGLKF
jgi:hypothetical protein